MKVKDLNEKNVFKEGKIIRVSKPKSWNSKLVYDAIEQTLKTIYNDFYNADWPTKEAIKYSDMFVEILDEIIKDTLKDVKKELK